MMPMDREPNLARGSRLPGAWWVGAPLVVLLVAADSAAQVDQVIDLRFPGKGIEKTFFSFTAGTGVAPVSFVGDVNGDGIDDVANRARVACPCGEVIFGA